MNRAELQEKCSADKLFGFLLFPEIANRTRNFRFAHFFHDTFLSMLPEYDFRVVGFMQVAVESNTRIHFETGSALSMLADEILGKGDLYGRFESFPIKPFSDYYGEELVLRDAEFYGADISRIMAPAVSNRCGGNPFYIIAVVRRTAELLKHIGDEEVLNEILAVDISSGFIWAELSDQVRRWFDRTNDYGIAKWVLYLVASQDKEEIDLEQIRIGSKTREFVDVPVEKIKEVMIRLARGYLLETVGLRKLPDLDREETASQGVVASLHGTREPP